MTMLTLFRMVVYTCTHCGSRQRIPLRRVHTFERFHELRKGEAVLIRCQQCTVGLQIPSPYTTHTGHAVAVDPCDPPLEAVIHDALC